MDRRIITLTIQFIGLVLIQVLILNNILFSNLLNPFFYIYFILVLPVDFRPSVGLIVGFLLGLSIDVFSQTLGMHTIATTFAAFCRPYVLSYMAPRDGYEFSRLPSVKEMGWLWFGTYSAILTFLHHLILFFVEMFRMSGIFNTVLKSLGSTVLTVILVVIIQLIFARRTSTSYE
jgi:cell shape-determining protein MreD